ncbi:hypothetical protein As57867_019216, partial [Aphanomyces stellatus]
MKTQSYQSVDVAPPSSRSSRQHPLDNATLFSKLFFSWATPLLKLGNERPLDPQDIWPLQPAYQCSVVGRVFEPAFHKSHRSIGWAMASEYGWQLLGIGLMQVATVVCGLYGPVVLRQIVSSMESNAFDLTQSLQLIASLVVVRILSALLSAHSTLQTEFLVVKVTSALQHLLFEKTLQLDATARRDKSSGEIANLFSYDIPTIVFFSTLFNQLWILPIQMTLTLVLLYDVIGWSTFVGAGVIVVTLGLNQVVSLGIQKHFGIMMDQRDVRMKAVNEVFGAIQIIKFNAWEEKFADKLAAMRAVELGALWHIFAYVTTSVVLLYLGPALITLASFAAHTMLQHETLLPSKLFAAVSLFTLLKYPFSNLSFIVSTTMRALVSIRRFKDFLDLSEMKAGVVLTPATIDPTQLTTYGIHHVAVTLDRASIGWDETKPLFEDINLTIKQGEFVVVHGAVGEGKSSLCAALLGEMDKFEGSIFVGGRVAYYSQQAWIQNMTIRENILFGKPYDRIKYNRVIEACALTKDLALFAAGDRAEIGQKGVNLSGGQKARISLARACYSDADIYILDSPLSAVDAIVQNEIFTKCFLGLLRHKTIVLVTHSPEIINSKFLDRTIEVKQGKLIETIVQSERRIHAPLLEPLVACTGYAVNEDDLLIDARATTFVDDYSLLVSPSVTTPLDCTTNWLFTPSQSNSVPSFDDSCAGQLVLDEERVDGNVSASVYLGYLEAGGGWSSMVWLFLVLAIWQALSVSSDLWLNVWSGTATHDAAFVDHAGYYLGIYAALSIGGALATSLRSLIVYGSALKASKTLFDQMTHALLHAPMRFFDQNPVGRILNRYTNDIGSVDVDIPFILGFVWTITFLAVCTLATAMYMTQYLGLILLPLLYTYVALGQFFVQPARAMERVNKTTKSPLLNLISESIEGALVIRAFGDKHRRRFQRMHNRNVDATNESMFAKQIITQWLTLYIQLVSVVVLAMISISLVWMHDRLSPGLIGLSLNYVFSSLSLVEGLVPKYANFEILMVAPERIAEYCKIKPEAPRVISGAFAKDWPTTGDIQFDNMAFRYKANDPLVLKDVNVHIHSGEKIGIVGRTGAGKSSLTMALFRINELASGCIKIDGMDIAKVGVKTLRSAIAIIPQTPVLFKGTLRNYLDPFGEFSDDELWACLHKVKLAERIGGVDGKLDSQVEENGENFSVGERQMLCMGRALLRQARIVVMDEATAAIDHETDQNLQRVIRTEFASSTV